MWPTPYLSSPHLPVRPGSPVPPHTAPSLFGEFPLTRTSDPGSLTTCVTAWKLGPSPTRTAQGTLVWALGSRLHPFACQCEDWVQSCGSSRAQAQVASRAHIHQAGDLGVPFPLMGASVAPREGIAVCGAHRRACLRRLVGPVPRKAHHSHAARTIAFRMYAEPMWIAA